MHPCPTNRRAISSDVRAKVRPLSSKGVTFQVWGATTTCWAFKPSSQRYIMSLRVFLKLAFPVVNSSRITVCKDKPFEHIFTHSALKKVKQKHLFTIHR